MRKLLSFWVFASLLSAAPAYVGSAACKTCHSAIYARWQKTPMANVVRDPKEHPEAIFPDLTKPDPLLKFKKEDIEWMATQVKPTIAKVLQLKEWTPEDQTGFGCSGCHSVAKE